MAGSTTGSSTFDLVLGDGISGPAKSANEALLDLKGSIESDVKRLGELETAMRQINSASQVDVAAFKSVSSAAQSMRDKIATAKAAFVAFDGLDAKKVVAPVFNQIKLSAASFGGQSFFDPQAFAKKDIEESKARFDGFVQSIKAGGGPIGFLAGRFTAMLNPVTALVTISQALATAILAVGAASITAAIALGRYALASADARRSELLHLQGLATLRNAFGAARGGADQLIGAIDRVSATSAQSRSQISQMGESLYRSGLRGANLADALEGLSIAESVQGERGAARFRAMAVSLARTGHSVRGLTDDYRRRLGGIAGAQAIGLTRQIERLGESVTRIFDGVRINKFLTGLDSVLRMFTQASVQGRALRQLVTSLFSPIFDAMSDAAPSVRRFFNGMILQAQEFVIGVLVIRNAFISTFGSPTRSHVDRTAEALRLGRIAAIGLGVVLLPIAVGFVSIGLAAYGAYQYLTQFANAYTAISTALTATGDQWASAGASLVDGLIRGVTGAWHRFDTTLTDLAMSGVNAVRTALGIHSPSVVFAGLGTQIPRGLAQGIDRSESEVSRAVIGMSDGAVATGASSTMVAPRSGANTTVMIEAVHVNASSEEAGRAAARAFREELATILEGVGIELGVPT